MTILFLTKDEILFLRKNPKYIPEGDIIIIPKVYEDKWHDARPNQIWYGSRFSAKSWTKALQFLIKARGKKYFRGIFARNSQKSAKDSQFQLFKDLLKKHPSLKREFEVNETYMKITHKQTGHFIKGGSFEQSDAIMGVPEVTDFWADEPINRKRSITRSEYEDIAGTLRNSEGVAPIMHLTFNPIGKYNFIYEDFFDEKKRVYDDTMLSSLKVNYYDNPFCPQDRIVYLDNLKERDVERWYVDGNGDWGEPDKENTFLKSFNTKLHTTRNLPFDEARFLTAGFDFNYDPSTCIIAEKCDYKGIRFYKEFQEIGIITNLTDRVKWLNSHKYGYEITGDNSGHNRDPASKDTCFDQITAVLKKPDEYTFKQNKDHRGSRELVDYVFWKLGSLIQIDIEGCPVLTGETINAEATKEGKLRKDDKDFRMDAFDPLRYIIHLWFETIEDVNNYYDTLMANRKAA